MQYANIPISDGHIHTFWNMPLEKREALLFRLMEDLHYDTVTILDIPYSTTRLSRCRDFTENLASFYLKSKSPDRIYAFAGMTPSFSEENNTPEFFLEQVKFYMQAGFDGVKMIEGRPTQRAVCGPFSSPKYRLVYDYCEKNEIPMVMHANADERCFRPGGSLSEIGFSWMDYYNDVLDVLKAHPKLRLTVAHFFFASEHPDLCRELLSTYENVYLDVCPNQYMYPHFAEKEEVWRPFFEEYQDRIIYGTDIGSNTTDLEGEEAFALYRMVRGFFEADAPFTELSYPIPPVKLPPAILEKIYKKNLMRFYQGKAPKALVPDVMMKEYEILMEKYFTLLDLRDRHDLKLIKSVLA